MYYDLGKQNLPYLTESNGQEYANQIVKVGIIDVNQRINQFFTRASKYNDYKTVGRLVRTIQRILDFYEKHYYRKGHTK